MRTREKSKSSSKINSKMVRNRNIGILFIVFLLVLLLLVAFIPIFASLPSLSSTSSPHFSRKVNNTGRGFEIAHDQFWKDGEPFRIIGGDVHYFRVLPEYWKDRLLRAKALGLNTIQTYVPWNLHEPRPGETVFEGIADVISFIKLCHKLDLLVMLRPGPYICGEWDFGGFPGWLLTTEPPIKLRSSDPVFLHAVEKWWNILLPKVAHLLYGNGGPIIMVQIENEYGSYGDDKDYLLHLIALARRHLGDEIILYTTDGGTRGTLEKGTIRGNTVYSAVDFSTGEDPWPIFKLQKEFNSPGQSPPLCSEFYTGWLTHWGEKIAKTDPNFVASLLGNILSRNGSAVLYMAHGGTNFGFYNGANTGENEVDYKPDLTSYDYDAPIQESGDVDNAKFKAIRQIIQHYSSMPVPSVPSNIKKMGYGPIKLQKIASLFSLLGKGDAVDMVVSENPVPMESVGQMFGLVLYVSGYASKTKGNSLFIPKVHDRAQIFISCPSEDNAGKPSYIGVVERWSNQTIDLPYLKCAANISLSILVENMGRVNYGQYIFDRKGILSSIYLDGTTLHGWKMQKIPLQNLNEVRKIDPIFQDPYVSYTKMSARRKEAERSEVSSKEPAFYGGQLSINEVTDTYISFHGWGKGLLFINEFNMGRYWPSAGPQCNLYIAAPVLHQGDNSVVVLELENAKTDLVVTSVDHSDFTCGASKIESS